MNCVKHPANAPFFAQHRWHRTLSDDRCTVAILAVFHLRYLGLIEDQPLLRVEDVSDLMYNLYKKDSIKSRLNKLVEDGLVKLKTFDSSYAANLCSQKSPYDLPFGDKICKWCRSITVILHYHHYPIKKSEGGTEIIGVCPSCHYEHHHLTDNSFYEPSDKLIQMFEDSPANSDLLSIE